MQRDLDCIRFHAEDPADFPGAEIRAVAECEQVARTLVEPLDGACERDAMNSFFLDILG